MEELKVRRLPVINKNKRMIGMLSLGDVGQAAPVEPQLPGGKCPPVAFERKADFALRARPAASAERQLSHGPSHCKRSASVPSWR